MNELKIKAPKALLQRVPKLPPQKQHDAEFHIRQQVLITINIQALINKQINLP